MKRRNRLILLLLVTVLLIPQPSFAADSASTKLSKLMTELWLPITIKDGWIYYLPSVKDQTSLYRIHTDGTGKQKVNKPYYINRDKSIVELFEEGSFLDQLSKDNLTTIYDIVGEWVYYYRWPDDQGQQQSEFFFYRIKKDGTQETKLAALNDGKPLKDGGVLAIQDDWVYIQGFGRRNAKGVPLSDLYRISTKGGKVEKIITGYEEINLRAEPKSYKEIKFTAFYLSANEPLAIKNGYIYYINSSDNFYLYRSTLDGKSKKKMASMPVAGSLIIDSDIVYFNTINKQGKTSSLGDMYRVGVDGTNLRKLGDGRGAIVMVLNGWAYFQQGDLVNGSMSRIRIDGSGKKKLTDYPTLPLGAYGDYMRYVKYSKGSPAGDYRMKLDGSEKTLINR
ncbi:DUF5050 domain-containing protein [Cohnella abietis]|uniref:Prolow-density lipoprotein receptor-related protein 1-like beta-propeller domain-containing protein n=1 Tax=Cohnella abietis TaxID=2507935 RepID=A0A3T1DCY3_9BACL|nr:DUF5050 domain-containing protein [Cohnella abietis]BBI35953.1 hypothetical protein KCTCHS21_53520 [Cohnella abietis]